MAERIYIASNASIVAVNGRNVGIPLGLVQNLTLEKRFVTEGVPEWGNFAWADILIHGYSATFTWTRAYSEGTDLIGQGLVPSDVEIPQFLPFILRVIANNRNVALIHKGIAETYSIGAGARAMLQSNVSGIAISLLTESEMN